MILLMNTGDRISVEIFQGILLTGKHGIFLKQISSQRGLIVSSFCIWIHLLENVSDNSF